MMEEEIVIILALLLVFTFFASAQRVEVKYFTSENCGPAREVDKVIKDINDTIGNEISLKVFNIANVSRDIKDKYKVYGVPTIVVNGRVVNEKYTEKNLMRIICSEMLVEPEVCK